MKVVISWSGQRSKALALSLREWMPYVINAVSPWMSEVDISPGARWFDEISGQLMNVDFGIVCITAENLMSEWLLFEAGAMSKAVDRARVCPLLLGVDRSELTGPLAHFQATTIDLEGIQKLMASINSSNDAGLLIPNDRLKESVETWWPKLKEAVDRIEPLPPAASQKPQRSDRELLQEVLENTRELLRPAVGQIWTFFVSPTEGMSKDDVRAAVEKAVPQANPESLLVRTVEDGVFEVSFSIAGRILEPMDLAERLRSQSLQPTTAEEIRVGRNSIDRRLRSRFDE